MPCQSLFEDLKLKRKELKELSFYEKLFTVFAKNDYGFV